LGVGGVEAGEVSVVAARCPGCLRHPPASLRPCPTKARVTIVPATDELPVGGAYKPRPATRRRWSALFPEPADRPAALEAIETAQVGGAVLGDDDVDVMTRGGDRAFEPLDQRGTPAPAGRGHGDDAQPAGLSGGGEGEVGMSADAADGGTAGRLHVDLPVDVDLEGRVDGHERPVAAGGGVGDVAGQQDGLSVGPAVEDVGAGEVGGGRAADQEAPPGEVDDGVGEQ